MFKAESKTQTLFLWILYSLQPPFIDTGGKCFPSISRVEVIQNHFLGSLNCEMFLGFSGRKSSGKVCVSAEGYIHTFEGNPFLHVDSRLCPGVDGATFVEKLWWRVILKKRCSWSPLRCLSKVSLYNLCSCLDLCLLWCVLIGTVPGRG